jgi:hypothetical protein
MVQAAPGAAVAGSEADLATKSPVIPKLDPQVVENKPNIFSDFV